jgi:hypothetical protein
VRIKVFLSVQASEESSPGGSTPREGSSRRSASSKDDEVAHEGSSNRRSAAASSKDDGVRIDEVAHAAYHDEEGRADEYTSLLPRGNQFFFTVFILILTREV